MVFAKSQLGTLSNDFLRVGIRCRENVSMREENFGKISTLKISTERITDFQRKDGVEMIF
jgi:hypothetical protein